MSSIMKGLVDETEAKKGADGKRCWKGKRYAGTKNGKDKCIPVKEESDEEALERLKKNKTKEKWMADADLEYMHKRHAKKKKDETNEGSERVIVQRPGRTTIVDKSMQPTPMARAAMGALAQHYQSELDDLNKKREARRRGDIDEGVIVGHDANDPEVAILGGAGTMSLSRLKNKAAGEAQSLFHDMVLKGNFKAAAYNIKQLANTLNTIVAAEKEMEKSYFGEDELDEARPMTPELRAAQQNLVDLASGEVRRREEARKAAAKRQREYERQAARAAKPKKPTLDKIWQHVEHAISNYFPDGDPTDYLNPYMDRNNLTWDDITRAAKRNGYSDLWDYWNTLSQDIENDAYYDWHAAKRPEAPTNPLSKDAADIQHSKWVAKNNPNIRTRGVFLEEPTTSGPVGEQPGGLRTYRPKPAGMMEGILDAFKKKPTRDKQAEMRSRIAAMSDAELRYEIADYKQRLPTAVAQGSLVSGAVNDYINALKSEIDKRAYDKFSAKHPEAMEEGIFDAFKKKLKKPELDLPKWPNSNNANDWMAAKAEYYAQHDPEYFPNLFSPASGDYLPMSVHVGSSWKPEHQAFYRELKKKYPEAVAKAKDITTGIAGRVSLSRVGDPADFHGMSIQESKKRKA